MPLDQYWNALPDMTMLGDAAQSDAQRQEGEHGDAGMHWNSSTCLISDDFNTVHDAIAFTKKRCVQGHRQ